jgi:hypothetical protein
MATTCTGWDFIKWRQKDFRSHLQSHWLVHHVWYIFKDKQMTCLVLCTWWKDFSATLSMICEHWRNTHDRRCWVLVAFLASISNWRPWQGNRDLWCCFEWKQHNGKHELWMRKTLIDGSFVFLECRVIRQRRVWVVAWCGCCDRFPPTCYTHHVDMG